MRSHFGQRCIIINLHEPQTWLNPCQNLALCSSQLVTDIACGRAVNNAAGLAKTKHESIVQQMFALHHPTINIGMQNWSRFKIVRFIPLYLDSYNL